MPWLSSSEPRHWNDLAILAQTCILLKQHADVNWIQVDARSVQQQALVNMVINNMRSYDFTAVNFTEH